MTLDVGGRTIIITGGGGFLALEFARALAQAGAEPVLADVDPARAEENRDLLSAEGLTTHALPVDITDPDAASQLVQRVVDECGDLHGLLNAAAIDPKFDPDHASDESAAFEDYPLELWERSLAVNVTGTFLMSQAALRHFLTRGRGNIVNVASIYGMAGPDQRLYAEDERLPPPRYKPVDYSVTKSAVFGFTRYLATYLAGTEIRVNSVTFGGIDNGHDQGFRDRYSRRVPMGRMGRRDEVGGVIAFLFSDASSYMTGSNVVVDGGWTAW